jgi:hypothetical protein
MPYPLQMSDFIQAIDVITKLLPQLKSFTGARRREYFTALLEPLFASLEQAHDFYNELFLETRQKVIEVGQERCLSERIKGIGQKAAIRSS